MNSFEELCVQVSHNIDAKEQRIRSRTEQEQARFNYAVNYLLIDLWKKHFTHKDYNSSIQKTTGISLERGIFKILVLCTQS